MKSCGAALSMDDDKELVKKTLTGEKKAFEMIIARYQQLLINYIGRMVGERELACDFAQEVFLRAYASLPSYQPSYRFNTWLFKIASHLVIDHWRKKKLRTVSYDQLPQDGNDRLPYQVPDDSPSLVKKFELAEVRKKIERALENIPPALRELFIWRHINGFSYEDIAEIKALPLGTVKNKVFQAKEMIRQILEEQS